MYSDVVREHTRIYREIREPLEKHAKYIGTNTGNYWVSQDGHSGLHSAQEVKIFEQMTDNLDLVARILKQMDTDARAKILGVMDSEVASQITKILDPEY